MPVSIIGTFAVMLLIGYSANTVSLLALVLAIGIVVDDAIVVVENIERVIEEEPDLSVPDACKKAMAEITGPILAITFVLLSVFVPVGAPTHVPARLRLSACQPGHRHAHAASVSRPSQHPAHRALHRAVTRALQEPLARLTPTARSLPRKLSEFVRRAFRPAFGLRS